MAGSNFSVTVLFKCPSLYPKYDHQNQVAPLLYMFLLSFVFRDKILFFSHFILMILTWLRSFMHCTGQQMHKMFDKKRRSEISLNSKMAFSEMKWDPFENRRNLAEEGSLEIA